MKSISPIILALICVVAWSFIPVVSRIGQLSIDNFQFLFWTNLLSTIAVGLTIRFKENEAVTLIKNTNYVFSVTLGFLGCFFYYLCLYYGYAHGNMIETLVIQYLWPTLIVIISIFLLNENLNLNKILSILLGFGATVLVVTKGSFTHFSFSNITVLLVVFVGAISFALFSVLSKKEKRHNVSFGVFLYFLWATVFSFITLIIWSENIIPDIQSMLIIVINGVIINGLSYILWIYALSKSDASKLAPLVYISPVLSMVWINLFFNEKFVLINFVAVIMVIVSGLLVISKKNNLLKHISG